jgi:hypothetical protein
VGVSGVAECRGFYSKKIKLWATVSRGLHCASGGKAAPAPR